MTNPDLTSIEKDIVKALYIANKPLTANQVAKRAECSWPTAREYLVSLFHKGITLFGYYEKGKHLRWFPQTDQQ
jgi:response regulator of citrate/malate metabolism